MRTFIAIPVLWLAAGCAHQYGGRATVLEQGHGQLTPAIEVDWARAQTGRGEDGAVGLPWLQLGMGYHHGVGSRVELGGRVFGAGLPRIGGEFGVAADLKVQLFRADDRDWGWDIAVALSPSWHMAIQGDQPFHFFGFTAPLLIGKNLGRHQIIFGLRVADFVITSYGQRPVNAFFVGTSLGFALRVRRVEIQPELAVLYSPVWFNGEQPGDRRGLTLVTLGVAVPIEVQGYEPPE